MALDPSIFQFANKPTVALQSPMDAAMKQLALQQAQQQVQQGGLQIQQLKKQAAEAEELQAILQGSQGPDDALSKVSKIGTRTAQEWLKAYREQQEKGITLDEKKFNLGKDKLAQAGQVLLGSAAAPGATPDSLRRVIDQGEQEGHLPPAQAQKLRETLPADAAGLKEWARLQGVQLGVAESTLKMFMPPKIEGWHEGVDTAGKPAVFGLKDGQPVKYEGVKPAIKQPLVHIGALTGPDKQTAIDQAALAMVQGRQKLPTGRELADPILGPAVQRARQIDPTLSQSTITLRQNAQKEADSGKIGQSNNSISTVLGHLGHLKEVFNRLPDRTGMKSLNWLEGKTKEMAPGGNPDLQEVYDLVEGIGPEMAKAYVQGGGTEGERHGWKERINPFRPMGERKASLNAFSSMLITKLNQNEAQYLKAFKGLSPNAMPAAPQLTEDAYNALKSIQEWTGKEIPGADKWIKRYEEGGGVTGAPTYTAPGQPAPDLKASQLPRLSVAEASKLKSGERFLDMNGKERVKK